MSLSTVQKYQLLRLVNPDGTVDNDDKFAFLGLTEASSFTLTSTQKKQLLRLAVPDATVTTSDKFAFLGYMEAQNPSGDIVEYFDITWNIGPTFTRAVNNSDGSLVQGLGPVLAGFFGENRDPAGDIPIATFPMKVTMHKDPITNMVAMHDQLSGIVKFGEDLLAHTNMSDELGRHVTVTFEEIPLVCGCVRFIDEACFHTTMKGHIAARTRTPGID